MRAGPLIFNGLDATTGRYAVQLESPRVLGRWIRRTWVAPEDLDKVVREGVDARKLDEAGWGVVFPQQSPAIVREALRPLLDRRRQQAGKLFRELTYRPGENKIAFLEHHGIGAGQGAVEPERLPYYLLLAGGPEEIPYEFQHQLDLQYAVGRLHFTHPASASEVDAEAYGRYALNVLAAESEYVRRPRILGFFAPDSENDLATRLMCESLVTPLADTFRMAFPGWEVEAVLAENATKGRLGRLLGGAETPAILFTATHGMQYPIGHPRQLPRQGALLCHGWEPRKWNQPVADEVVFAAEDVEPAARPAGLVAFHFACFSGGTPRSENFTFQEPEVNRPALASEAFTARLPQRLLAAEQGALAVIGHVDRAWTWSFSWQNRYPLLSTFESVLRRLLSGYPVGAATEYLGGRYGELAAELLRARADGADAETLGELWTACHDARNYVVLGDPAVRLAVER